MHTEQIIEVLHAAISLYSWYYHEAFKVARSIFASSRPSNTAINLYCDLMFDLNALGNKPQTSRTDCDVVTTELSGRSQNSM